MADEKVDLELDDGTAQDDEVPYEEQITRLACISKPLATKKLTKRLYKSVKKARKCKNLRRGVKEVVKFIRKGEKGFVIIAGDISPIDVVSHIPVYCEDRDIPYVYVPSRHDLGKASLTKRPASVVLVKNHDDYKSTFEKCFKEIKDLPLPV